MRDHAKERFRAAFEQLPERERQVAVRLYLHNLTLREIGEALGVTESRVCQIHSQLRRRLRELLESDEQLFSEVAVDGVGVQPVSPGERLRDRAVERFRNLVAEVECGQRLGERRVLRAPARRPPARRR